MDAVFHFIRAALPWIAVGLLLAVLFARSAGKNKYLFPFYFVLKNKNARAGEPTPGLAMAKEVPSGKRNHGRGTAPGHNSSPGIAHSSKAEVASEKLQKVVLHAGSCSFPLIPTVPVGLWEL